MTHFRGKLSVLALLAAAALPTFAASSTVFIGFEDHNAQQNSDYDYNDWVGSMTADGLTVHSETGVFTLANSSSESGSPFWANTSYDGAKFNVGYCVYGGGNCGTGLATEPTSYLATLAGGSVSDVFFTTGGGNVNATVSFMVSADTDDAGYYLLSDNVIHWAATTVGGMYSFNPGGQAFGIAGRDRVTGGVYRTTDGAGVSQFAIFDPPTEAPEPASFALTGSMLLVAGLMFRKRFARSEELAK